MKKLLAFCFAITTILVCAACASSDKAEPEQPAIPCDGFSASAIDGILHYHPEALPFSIDYNGGKIGLNDVKIYEIAGKNDEHTMFVVVDTEMVGIPDDEIEHIKNDMLSMLVFTKSGEKGSKSVILQTLGALHFPDENRTTKVFMTPVSESFTGGFSDYEVSVSLDLKHDEPFIPNLEGVSQSSCQEESISWWVTASDLASAEEIEKPLYDYVSKWLAEKNVRLLLSG